MEENKNLEQNNAEVGKEPEKAVDENTKSVEQELAEARLENAKLKKALDKSSSETASYKKQLRERQSADEIAAQEKAEADAKKEEAYQALLKENTVTKFEKSFLALGYGEDLANKAALAQYEGDTTTLFDIQKSVMENMQKNVKAELQRNMSTSPISNNSNVSMTQADFDKLSLSEMSELYKSNRELYNKFSGH